MSKIIKRIKYPTCTETYIKIVSVSNRQMTFTKIVINSEKSTITINIQKNGTNKKI